MGDLIIGGKVVWSDAKMLSWHETGWDATAEYCIEPAHPCPGVLPYGQPPANNSVRRYALRPALRKFGKNPPYEAVAKQIHKFVLHHDGVDSARTCWNVLQNERGLSCHFLIDNDGTIYQTCDLGMMAYHAAVFNVDSIGVEFCSRGDVLKDPAYYSKRGMKRDIELCKINGHTYKAWQFTPEQMTAIEELAGVLVKFLPELPLEYPTEPGSSKPYWNTLGPVDAKGDSIPAHGFRGYIGHYHLTRQKWDPGPFNFQKFIEKLRGRRAFPVWAGAPEPGQSAPYVPSGPDPEAVKAEIGKAAQRYIDLNEKEADGGFFPVGPWGALRLWHGGVHLPAAEGTTVHAPFAGRVVAARLGRTTPIGSANFVLLRHDVNLGGRGLRFWSLYMHLAEETDAAKQPKWMTAPRKPIDAGVDLLDHSVEAGEVIGHVGVVGPDELAKAQIHFEIFTKAPLFRSSDPEWAAPVSGSGGRFCDVEEITSLIDGDKDGRLSRQELVDFYAGGVASDELRKIPVLHVSEWTDTPSWRDELAANPADLHKKVGKKSRPVDGDDDDYDLDELVASQLDPFIWWTEPVADALGLPADGVVYHYHPIRLLEKLNQRLTAGKEERLEETEVVSTEATKVTDDATGEGMIAAEDAAGPDDQHLKLQDLVMGWEGDRPPPRKGGTP